MVAHNNELKGRDADATLSNIIQSPENTEKVFTWLKKNEGILTLSGNSGCGKTYLCKAIYNDWIKRKLGTRFMYITDFLSQIRSMIEGIGDCSFEVKRLAGASFFILDDFGATTMNEWQTEILTDFINERHENMLPTILTTNKTNGEIFRISKRIYSRLNAKCNVFLDLSGVDQRLEKK